MQIPTKTDLPLGRRPATLALVAAVVALLLTSGCGGLIFDPSKRIETGRGHITDQQGQRTPTGGSAAGGGGIAIGDDVPTQGNSVRRGSGTFVRPVAPRGVDTTPGEVTLNFDGTDIREVVKVILGDLLGVNYVLDPAVSGSASLETGRPLRKDMLIPTLEMLLRMNNAALVDNLGTYEIVPLTSAVEGRIVPQLGSSSRALPEGYSVQVVPLRYIGAQEMASILEPMAPEGSVIRVDNVRNIMVLAGTSPEMSNLLDTIQVFDVDWMAGLSVGFFVLEYAKANEVVTQLETLLADDNGNPFTGLFRFIPVESANAVLVVSPQQSYLAQMEDWIDRLDRAEAAGSSAQRLFVYRVRHGDAENLADVLSKLFASGEGGSSSTRSVGGVAPGLRQASIGGEDGGGDTGGGAALQRATASTLQLSSEVSIVADPVNNSLLVRSSPRDYKRILDALKQLDIVPLQVLVEATIVEIRLSGNLQYGVQWQFFGLAAGGKWDAEEGRNRGGYRSAFTLPNAGADGANQFSWTVLLRPDVVRATLTALAEDDLVNVLSSPSVMVRDNQTAEIFVGQDVPVLSTQQQGTATTDRVVNNIEYRQTGVKLSVKPRVTPGGAVQMEIEQEVSDVAPEAGVGDSPVFRERKINSVVSVRSNQAVVLGGLIQDLSSDGKSGVPGLYRAPLIGPLFGNTSRQAERTELVVVLTPRVIASDSDIETVTRDFRAKVRNLDTRF